MIKNIIDNWNLAKKKCEHESKGDKFVIIFFFEFSWIDIKHFFYKIRAWIINNHQLIFQIMVIIFLCIHIYNLYQMNKFINSANKKLKIVADSVSTSRVIEPKLGDRVE